LVKCRGTSDCGRPCQQQTGCPNSKCINRMCKCYGC
uniref:Potassium channel toxin alpha-KTx 6.1 n=1 Tax=Pandinus imperator TaxID=55084 RepID=KAX61_PANIM|nr:RecName: Full=Potassium channel toxin alpha-KTx 6.1; AltName: Full=PiTX-K-gamma; AltName: Full=Potassium channel-blocking toxin 1; Short=Pi-1; Short=Pi1 [Pandinus imperator]AAB47862.1 K+-channel blocking toxin Pi1 [Pandinus imperator=scorpions, venom, Peptide, 35 aa] [Pandinus imperator]